MTPAEWAAEVAAVEHDAWCNVRHGASLTHYPVVRVAAGDILFEPSCTCTRDARIGRKIAAVRESDALAVASDWSDPAIDAAALAAWRETT